MINRCHRCPSTVQRDLDSFYPGGQLAFPDKAEDLAWKKLVRHRADLEPGGVEALPSQ